MLFTNTNTTTKTVTIVTHDGWKFHSDEVTFVAIEIVFGGSNVKVIRTRDNDIISSEASKGSLIADVGGKYDGVQFFDHHHDTTLLSSAGLYWKTFKLEEDYPQISRLIKKIDDQDRGIELAGEFEIPALITHFSRMSKNVDDNFTAAVEFMVNMLRGMKEDQDEISRALEILKVSEVIEDVIYLNEFTSQWQEFVNREKMPEIKAVAWYDEREKKMKAQVAPNKAGSFDFKEGFSQDSSMEFVHGAGFFCVAKDMETMKNYLKTLKNVK